MDRHVFITPEAFKRCVDGHVIVVCNDLRIKRESQYQTDMTQLSANRRSRSETVLDFGQQGVRDS